jgi:hypothetical protein
MKLMVQEASVRLMRESMAELEATRPSSDEVHLSLLKMSKQNIVDKLIDYMCISLEKRADSSRLKFESTTFDPSLYIRSK